MKIHRMTLLKKLKIASLGLSEKGIVEQSECFIFSDGKIFTFNDEIMVRVRGYDDFNCAIPAKDMITLLEKFPDEELDISQSHDKGELLFVGKNRKAGLPYFEEIVLSVKDVPKPKGWIDLSEEVFQYMKNAALVCGNKETWGVTSCVHITPNVIEGCDNHRLFRAKVDTGIDAELFIPATGLYSLSKVEPIKIAVDDNWCHFGVKGAIISVRCREFKEYLDVEKICKVKGGELVLPKALKSVVSRAKVTSEGMGFSTRITVELKKGCILVQSSSGRGWFKEKIKDKYKGPGLIFDVHPDLLDQVLNLSGGVIVGKNRMCVKMGDALFIIALLQTKDE